MIGKVDIQLQIVVQHETLLFGRFALACTPTETFPSSSSKHTGNQVRTSYGDLAFAGFTDRGAAKDEQPENVSASMNP
jgi:hypothetical protein